MAASIVTCPAKMWTISPLIPLPRRLLTASCIQYRRRSYAIKLTENAMSRSRNEIENIP